MFIAIEEYIQRSREERCKHLDLEEQCIEIGGSGSGEFRGLLAHFLQTTIPKRTFKNRVVVLCHACHNGKCSNPRHLYWGTYRDNRQDAKENGQLSVWDYTIAKFGEQKAKALRSVSGQHNNRPNRLSKQEVKRRLEVIKTCDPPKRGWINKAAKKLNISHTTLRQFYAKYADITQI